MAVRAHSGVVVGNNGYFTVTWTGLLQSSSDTGAWVHVPPCVGLTAQLQGTLGTGGAITMQGSNDDGTSAGTLVDYEGNAGVMDAIGEFSSPIPRPVLIRPSVTAGNGSTDLDVVLSGQIVRA
jgi:hypothetical protein